MKNLLLLFIAITFFSCSTEDDPEEQNEEMCCGTPKSEIIEYINTEYPRLLSHETLSDEQRRLIEDEYDWGLENPCALHERSLERSGASCEDPW